MNKGGFFEFIPQAGVYLSIPVGKLKGDLDATISAGTEKEEVSKTREDKIDNSVIFGTAFGCDFAFNFSSHSALLLNLRYLLDLAKLKSDGDDVGARRTILFSAGYRHTL